MSRFAPLRPFLRAPASNLVGRSFSTSPSRAVARMTVVGHLGADPELVATSTGQDLVRYVVASSYGPKDNRQTSWFRIASFVPEGPGRDHLLGLQKGTLVYVEGDASMRSYEDSDGKKQSSLSIVQRSLEVLKRPSSGSESGN